jgi:hypothetical protein
MKTAYPGFWSPPSTTLGRLGLGLSFLLIPLFLFNLKYPLQFPTLIMLPLLIGLLAELFSLLALVWKHDQSWLLWLLAPLGLFAVLFSVGQVLFPL